MKKLSAHQTYFFPYLGYFSVLNIADYYVHMDSFQYARQSWMNRNRIIASNEKVGYIIVPTKKASQKTRADEILIDREQPWEKRIIGQLGYYKKKAPFYKEVLDIMEELFDCSYSTITDLSMKSVELVNKYLKLKPIVYKFSDLNIVAEYKVEPDEWGILICKQFPDVDTYCNAPGGKSFYSVDKYKKAGLDIKFLQNRLRPYDQKNDLFIPGLSIIDVMMFNSPEDIREMINDYYFL